MHVYIFNIDIIIKIHTLVVRPVLILPGHQATAGTLNPPSQVVVLPHLNGPALPPQ